MKIGDLVKSKVVWIGSAVTIAASHMVSAAYTAVYSVTDMVNALIDFMAAMVVAFVGQAGLIATVLVATLLIGMIVGLIIMATGGFGKALTALKGMTGSKKY